MNRFARVLPVLAMAVLAVSQQCLADPAVGEAKIVDGSLWVTNSGVPFEKSMSTRTLGSRATVTSSAPMYGGFEVATSGSIYILVRGNSLGTLGVTQAYLDAPRVRIFNSLGQDLLSQGGFQGFNSCLASNTTTDLPVLNYYQNVRGQPAHSFDACFYGIFTSGVFTFQVTPSIVGTTSGSIQSVPTFGEVLFEITLNP
jgi:hypothetical protein